MKIIAVFALALLIFSAIQPALMAYGKEEDEKKEKSRENEDKRSEETKKGEAKKGAVTAEQAIANATRFLIRNYGNSTYDASKVDLVGENYKIRIGNSTTVFEVMVSGRDGRVISAAIKEQKEKEQRSSNITVDQAKANATRYLLSNYGNATYKFLESESDGGNYKFKIENSTAIFKIIVSGKDGRILSIEVQREQRKEEKKEDKKEARESRKDNQIITFEQARSNVTRYLLQNYGNATYRITETEFNGINYKFKIVSESAEFEVMVSGKDGSILTVKVEKEKRQETQRREERTRTINATQATSIALGFLQREFGSGNYTIVEVKLEGNKYTIKLSRDGERFEVKVDALAGAVLEFEHEVKEEKKEDKPKVLDERKEKKEEKKQEPAEGRRINASQAVSIALEFLRRQVGEGNYSIISIKLDDVKFNVKLAKGEEEFELKVHGVTGKVLEFEQEKKVKIKVEKEDERHIRVDMKNEDVRQKLNVQIQKNDASIKLEFQGRENMTKSELELRVLFDRLIEFMDNGTQVGIFDSNDTIISSLDLRRLQWSVSRVEYMDANGTVTMITITQNASSASVRSIAFIYHLTPTTKTVMFANDTIATIRIWQIKFDVHIQGFNWKSNDTMLALAASFNSNFEAHIPGESTVKFRGADGITPFFNWGGDATADNASITVSATLGEKSIVLTYPHFDDLLVHDPLIGYMVPSSIPIEILVPSVMVLGAIIVASVVLGTSAIRAKRMSAKLRELAGSSYAKTYAAKGLG